MENIKMITRYRTFDIKMNDSRKFIITFDSQFLNRFPYEFEESFEIVSEARDAIDRYWRNENRKFSEGMLI
ncbi:hypothetical protein P7H71_09600 [Lactococcus lactis]|uniref:Uncharacterized protein n=4 Tax=Lactococcus lactis TaxID=1358 RepID=S6F7E4_LACLL|nr:MULTISPECIES: hypothetical protein [Lactococcus]MDN6244602.1 hypothetical protein [Tetragenococcus koreensis]MDN6386031.1 hypothetical protein [Alkalibacterium sp.]ARE21617.2 hypothetical protein LLUC06_2075 [Lactococcus lactis subsp. lactis]MCA2389544.1 hypothetical protein [Lactococcus sp. NH2-7C]MCO0830531.1 hypothetical protein [Lactococcus lactis]